MFSGIEIEQILGLAGIAAIISVIGTWIGIILKDYLFSRAFESWKQKNSLNQIYQKFKDPLLLSARELCTRLMEILDEYPTCYLRTSVLNVKLDSFHADRLMENSSDDPYYQRYKLVSTTYRLSSFLGWLELYRQEIVFLTSGNYEHSKRLEKTLDKIRSALADGQLNTADNWLEWKDMLIFREEIRAIGESMLDSQGMSKTVIGYRKFSELFYDKDTKQDHIYRWVSIVLSFLLDLEQEKDFRKNRLILLTIYLIQLLKLLDSNKLEQRFIAARKSYVELLVNCPLLE